MNNVDLFLKYLDGEMDRKEAAELERNLETDHRLRQEFEEVSEARALIRAQLRKRDENDFKMRLREVMERSEPGPPKRHPFSSGWRLVVLPLAGVLALLLAVFLWFGNEERLVSRYYQPDEDPVILALSDLSRGGAQPGILLYNQGRFTACMEEMEQQLQTDPGNRLALLYYLLAAIETGNESAGLRKYASFSANQADQIDQAVQWYATLAMIRTGGKKEAIPLLKSLADQTGPYRSDARKLLMRVSK